MKPEFGAYVRRCRLARGLTLRAAAKNAGISHPYLSQVERGENRRMSDDKLIALAKALNHDVDDFFRQADRLTPKATDFLLKELDLIGKYGDWTLGQTMEALEKSEIRIKALEAKVLELCPPFMEDEVKRWLQENKG